MILFDELVDQALQSAPEFAPLRVVVEKELLHHDIMRVLSTAGLLTHLCFIGGTCLRACYGSNRLSEDLYFTGGAEFSREQLTSMASVLVESLKAKYGLEVSVTEPTLEKGNVDTWKLKVQTRPARRDIRAQRIHIDVCSVPSYQVRPTLLLNPYGVDMGTNGLVLGAQSREEIFADKLVAFALRPNRLKNRDLWDIAWLHQQRIKPALELIALKLKDHHASPDEYLKSFARRVTALSEQPEMVQDFREEMSRFLSNYLVNETVYSDPFWGSLCNLMASCLDQVKRALEKDDFKSADNTFSL